MGPDDTVATACLDEFGHLLFLYTIGHDLHVYRFNPESPSVSLQHLVTKTITEVKDDPDGAFIVSMEYVQELEAAVLAFSNGDIYLFDVQAKAVKEAGMVDGAIIAAKWSPNEEYYAVASDQGKILLFTPEWEVLYEADIDDGDLTFADGQEVTEDDRYIGQACITWRGDSSTFQINYSINGGFKCLARDVE